MTMFILSHDIMDNALYCYTVKHCYRKHTYNEFTLAVKGFSFPIVLKYELIEYYELCLL